MVEYYKNYQPSVLSTERMIFSDLDLRPGWKKSENPKRGEKMGFFYCRALKNQEWIRKWEGKAGCLKTPTKLTFGRYEFAFGRHETNTLIYDR